MSTKQEIRCACFIPGGVQCIKPMRHTGDHQYEPIIPFSEEISVEHAIFNTQPGQGEPSTEMLRCQRERVVGDVQRHGDHWCKITYMGVHTVLGIPVSRPLTIELTND